MSRSMKIIGITGPTGSGKSELCTCLSKHGIPNINADRVYHQILTPPSECLDAVTAHFGKGILNADGTLNRRALAAIVFSPGNEHEHDMLNKITHAYICERIGELIDEYSRASCSCVALDLPLLFEAEMEYICDFTVAVISDRPIRIDRIMNRDGLDYSAAMARISAQPSDDFYISRADHIIRNNSDIDALESELYAILKSEGCQ